jgi:ferredoxin-type protein NapG
MPDDEQISRRDLLRGRLFKGAFRAIAETASHAASAIGELRDLADDDLEPPPPPPYIPLTHRPPGACEELAFVAQCTKCDACVRDCPVDAIVHAPALFAKAVGTPMIEPLKSPCVMCEDTPCVTACQREGSGVLSPLLPLTMGIAKVMKASCLNFLGEPCSVCIDECPVAGAIDMHNEIPRVRADACTGCGVCANKCPATPRALAIIPIKTRPPLPIG